MRTFPYKTLLIALFILLIPVSACRKTSDTIVFPYSQWTLGISGHRLEWTFDPELQSNNSFIEVPVGDSVSVWHEKILRYREVFFQKTGKEEPLIAGRLLTNQAEALHWDKIGYDMKFKPGEKIRIQGSIMSEENKLLFTAHFDLKHKGEELSYVVRKKIPASDSCTYAEVLPSSFIFSLEVPDFDTAVFSATPVMSVSLVDTLSNPGIILSDIRLSVPFSIERKVLNRKLEAHIKSEAKHTSKQSAESPDWMDQNFVMGFVFIHDRDFFDPETGKYQVGNYCRMMEQEFGGMQSVILWHSYPNIGIDERNQFELFHSMPGGIEGLKEVCDSFHANGVKVFLTYNPWDLDTRRPGKSDAAILADILKISGADGIYLDTWKSSCGVISIFSEPFIRDEVAKAGRELVFSTEIFPEFKDLRGYHALDCSWGQEIHPFHYTDLSHIKWLYPDHKQHFINRGKTERRRELSHAWINGQGIQVWENIFGSMNLWNATDRQRLRKMNRIWKDYGRMYLSEDWLPFLTGNDHPVQVSTWKQDDRQIWNMVGINPEKEQFFYLDTEGRNPEWFYDLWNGSIPEMIQTEEKTLLKVKLTDFGCILYSEKKPEELPEKQGWETALVLPSESEDLHAIEKSLKEAIPFTRTVMNAVTLRHDLISILSPEKTMTGSHIWREGKCYPNADGRDNHDLDIRQKEGVQTVFHQVKCKAFSFRIMPRVVTNRQFETFVLESGYQPTDTVRFLKHWESGKCPEDLLDDPVVYVSMEDARAYAAWAGMRLPTEWEWQASAEIHPLQFRINEVWEWNESLRDDGHNRSVSLRGGCSRWTLPSSWWYFPGAPYGKVTGGAQQPESHCKYFLMSQGMDRASTIGFRCVLQE